MSACGYMAGGYMIGNGSEYFGDWPRFEGYLVLLLARYLYEENVLPMPGALMVFSPWMDMDRDPKESYTGYPQNFTSIGDAEAYQRECEQLGEQMRSGGVDVTLDVQTDAVPMSSEWRYLSFRRGSMSTLLPLRTCEGSIAFTRVIQQSSYYKVVVLIKNSAATAHHHGDNQGASTKEDVDGIPGDPEKWALLAKDVIIGC
ncbi:uncharacterized protein EV420DRAFT_1479330 [Desarmillaria tabescens]|uniref:Uncharacterized protein n=1 Tax=Armillaria tabescens TaxID=1929756 RepID=A0AA39KI36_ARMTA|nr:uncharacterized protein EV420DRAFT_1479330 [Desarmillaria tabescens]KAK0459343.1 hypothetical protein EV420DRAFT_1479330 [Desarmillaria tabescens]